MPIQGLAHELQVGIGDRRAQGLAAMEAVGFNGVANGIRVNAQLSGDGADFPMLGVEITANLDVGFWTDRLDWSSGTWNSWEGVNETAASAAEEAAQQLAGPLFGPTLGASRGHAGYPR